MPVPLFDIETPLAPLRAAMHAQARASRSTRARSSSARRSPPSRRSSPPTSASPHVVGVANGTDALVLALRALGVGPGDDVVVPSFTFYASAEAIPLTGAAPGVLRRRPRDVLRHRRHGARGADAGARRRSSPCTCSATSRPSREIEALGVPVVEDAAQAARLARARRRAARARSGPSRRFSFFPSKNLGGFGDGGAVATADDELAERVRMLRFHGSRDKQTLRARRPQLAPRRAAGGAPAARSCPHLDAWCEGRRAGAGATTRRPGLGELVALPVPADGADPAWHLYVVRHERADALAAALGAARDRAASAYYRVPTHLPAGDAAVGAGRRAARAPTRPPATHLAHPDEPGAHARAGRRGRRRGARCGSGLT